MLEKLLLLLISIIFTSSFARTQALVPVTGPSLENTVDWVSINVVNVTTEQNGQYRQSFTYDLERRCHCRFKVKNLDADNNLITKTYSFHLGDIDPDKITIAENVDFSEIKLITYKKKDKIQLSLNNEESLDHTFVIYEQSPENARRLSKALKHIASLCKQ